MLWAREDGRRSKERVHNAWSITKCVVLGPLNCHNTEPQTGWLITTEFILSQFKARSRKSRYWQSHAPSESLGDGSSLPLLAHVASGIPWLVAAELQYLPSSSCDVFVSLCICLCLQLTFSLGVFASFLMKTQVIIGLKAQPIPS